MNENTNPTAPLPTTLYLRLSDSRICVARYDKHLEPTLAFSLYHIRPQASLAVNLREAIQAEPILQSPTQGTTVMVSTPITLMPLAEFQEEDCSTIYNFCFPEDQPRRIFYDIVPTANAVLMFSLNEQICHNLEECFDNVRYISAQTPMLRRFSTKGINHNVQKRLFVYRHEKSIDVAIFEGTRLIIANSYMALNDNDVAYYVLNLSKQQGIDPDNGDVYIAGNTLLRENAVHTLREFTNNVYSINPPAEFNRHLISLNENIPYDMMSLLLD